MCTICLATIRYVLTLWYFGTRTSLIGINVLRLLIVWGWIVAGAAPGLQIRVSGRRTFRGVFDSHASPPTDWAIVYDGTAARRCLF